MRGVLVHARWVKCESTDTPTTSQFMSWNSLALSLNEMISVGHTKVLQYDKDENQVLVKYLPTQAQSVHLERTGEQMNHSTVTKALLVFSRCTSLNLHFNEREASCCSLCARHKYSQIQWVEEEDQVFALEISEAHFLELPIVDSCALKVRRRLSDSRTPPGRA